ncbi:aspartic proteinase CDR1-like [Gossypium australe]|uniref:Aspartic proteinase CDR1-like n=1 Tax=Gossypium australe TaxID=47621 RepID=A0A5B6VB38_9ROSI|nr:aspartic proteinase CDR1-like [Gossypium australe]
MDVDTNNRVVNDSSCRMVVDSSPTLVVSWKDKVDVDMPIPRVIDDRDRPIREHVVPILNDLNPVIVRPTIQAQHFELKLVMFQMLQKRGQFSGLPTEDPRLHLSL